MRKATISKNTYSIDNKGLSINIDDQEDDTDPNVYSSKFDDRERLDTIHELQSNLDDTIEQVPTLSKNRQQESFLSREKSLRKTHKERATYI